MKKMNIYMFINTAMDSETKDHYAYMFETDDKRLHLFHTLKYELSSIRAEDGPNSPEFKDFSRRFVELVEFYNFLSYVEKFKTRGWFVKTFSSKKKKIWRAYNVLRERYPGSPYMGKIEREMPM